MLPKSGSYAIIFYHFKNGISMFLSRRIFYA
jgi:hypothetical protein